jgi:hypothetical protein
MFSNRLIHIARELNEAVVYRVDRCVLDELVDPAMTVIHPASLIVHAVILFIGTIVRLEPTTVYESRTIVAVNDAEIQVRWYAIVWPFWILVVKHTGHIWLICATPRVVPRLHGLGHRWVRRWDREDGNTTGDYNREDASENRPASHWRLQPC